MTVSDKLENDASTRFLSKCRMRVPTYWEKWFLSLGDGEVKETNLNIFFQFGMALESLNEHVSVKESVASAYPYLYPAWDWLNSFLYQTQGLPLKDSRNLAEHLIALTREMIDVTVNTLKFLYSRSKASSKSLFSPNSALASSCLIARSPERRELPKEFMTLGY
jgi:hypothetical protein